MPSLCRRKAQPKSAEEATFLHLPDDILISIFSQCRIDEILAWRLTHARARSLIDEYMATIAPAVALATFPHSDRLIRPLEGSTKYNFRWLKGLIPRQLAALLVDRHRIADEWMQSRYGIPAEDPFGDELRARVTNGWCVLRSLSNISREVHGTPAKSLLGSRADIANKLLRPSRFKLEALVAKEDIILSKRLDHIRSLPVQHAKDYKLMMALLSATFSTSISNVGAEFEPWIFDWGDGIDGQRAFRKGQTWLASFVLAQGPDLFWMQWWSLPHDSPQTQNYIRDLALHTFRQLPTPLVDHQRSLAHFFQTVVNEQADVMGHFDGSNPFPYFKEYAKCRRQRELDNVPPFGGIMADVPFRVNFKCPEELVNRTALLLEAPRTTPISRGP
ncbi:hypothetical protein BKA66DRAFT_477825 [Pyrenochaeta sp. MPI-SDFR-AT-0127]|nr:hypothetical protein BKA66DRAFT_477825 [Pyrenochaeta sp. MPI-SDFR-AT-0127]